MKLGILSDLHIDLNDRGKRRIIPGLCELLQQERVRMLLLAGDLANNYQITLQSLYEIEQQSGVPCLFVPGNHDIWNLKYRDRTTWDIYQALQAFPGNLARGPYHLSKEWVVIGDIGWYDYSFGHPRFTVEEFDRMEFNEMLWQDKLFASWDRPAIEVSNYFYGKLRHQLEENRKKKIICMTHIVPHEQFIVHSPHEMWGYFNGFLGSKAYGELLTQYPVHYAVFGHVHYRKRRVIDGITYICNSLGYTREWYHDDPVQELRRAFTTIEIDKNIAV